VLVVAGYKAIRNFNRPAPALAQASQNPQALIFVNYVSAMNQVQEKVSAVIHNHDSSDVSAVMQRAMQAPLPDARAGALRNHLLDILLRLTHGGETASPPPSPSPGTTPAPAPELDQKLVDEYNQWRKEYEEWLKHAAKTYTSPN
jgi:hypothetical protein